MINGLDIYYSKKERSYGKGLAPISTNKKTTSGLKAISKTASGLRPISKRASCKTIGRGLRILQ